MKPLYIPALLLRCLSTACAFFVGFSACATGGYLFAHMTHADYGSLFYSISRDGYTWETLNNGRTVLPAFVGHPDICKGRNGIYYMISVKKDAGIPLLWSSTDLLTWKSTALPKSIFNRISAAYGYKNEETYYGAPKMFYDESTDQYIITWHAGVTGNDGDPNEWASKRTFYILTSDFRTFSPPKFLFAFNGSDANMATIDVIIRKFGDTYYAFMKDERTSDVSPSTAKTIRIATSKQLTGPYGNPGNPITPLSPGHEAHTIVSNINGGGYFLYAEDYNSHTYHLFEAASLDNTWVQRDFNAPEARHGCVIEISDSEYQALKNHGEWLGQSEITVKDVSLTDAYFGTYKGAKVYLMQDETVEFCGITHSEIALQDHFWKSLLPNRAVFKGQTGEYDIIYDEAKGVMYTARLSDVYPDALWITGKGYAHPSGVRANEWQMTAIDAVMCNKVAENIFEASLYLYNDFDIKTFKAPDINTEFGSNVFTPYPESYIDNAFYATEEGNAHPTGDYVPGNSFVPGKYTLRFNVAKGICALKDLADDSKIVETYKINGQQMLPSEIDGRAYVTVELDLTKGQNVNFDGFRHLEYMLQPEYFKKSGDSYTFCAVDGRYRISYSIHQERIYVERVDKYTFNDGVMFLTGANFGHPASTWLSSDMCSWGFTPNKSICVVSNGDGIYETHLNLRNGFVMCCYTDNQNWNIAVKNTEYTITGDNTEGITASDDGNSFLGASDESFNPGTYNVVFNTNNKTVNFKRVAIKNQTTTGIVETVMAEDADRTVVGMYNLAGVRIDGDSPAPGIYIVKYSDGSSQKMVFRK